MSDQVLPWPALYFALQILQAVLAWLSVTYCRGDTHSIFLTRLLHVSFMINRYPVEVTPVSSKVLHLAPNPSLDQFEMKCISHIHFDHISFLPFIWLNSWKPLLSICAQSYHWQPWSCSPSDYSSVPQPWMCRVLCITWLLLNKQQDPNEWLVCCGSHHIWSTTSSF